MSGAGNAGDLFHRKEKNMLSKIEKREDIKPFVKEARRMIKEYGWEDRTMMPYCRPVRIVRIIRDLEDYGICTESSRDILKEEADGLADIMNFWEAQQIGGIDIKMLDTGEVYKHVHKELAKELVSKGFAKYV